MFRKIAAVAASMLLLLSCNSVSLPRGNWSEDTYAKLSAVLGDHPENSYAVFDYDNTTIFNDVEVSLLVYQLENMRFSIEPEDMFEVLTGCVPDIDCPLGLEGAESLTARMLAEDICEDYAYLCGRKGEDLSSDPRFLDFRAKTYALSYGVSETFDYAVGCLWILKLFKGMDDKAIADLCKESCAFWTAKEQITEVTWESPEMGRCGKVVTSHLEGIRLTEDMKNLYSALRKSGIDVYICSASLEVVVEAMACDPVYGLGMDPEHVFALRLADGEFDPEYIQTIKAGKTAAIKAYIAPEHGGQGPILVAGDSNGDVAMLTDFPDMKLGLIMYCGNGGRIGELAALADVSPLYARQPRDLSRGCLTK